MSEGDRPSACPLHYRYTPAALRIDPSLAADTVYVIGGLYGNVEALEAVLRMRDAETRAGLDVALVFNGDFNWFDIDPDSFRTINEAVLQHLCIKGNVEAEIGDPSAGGCGCNYPSEVDPGFVVRSDAIMACLQRTGIDFPRIRARLAALPMLRVVQVGALRVGIVHGDADSLAGWRFAADRLQAAAHAHDGHATPAASDRDAILRAFAESAVDAIACTHTCLPFAAQFTAGGAPVIIVNNGAAGMPNFRGTTHGVITRISTDLRVPAASLYGARIRDVRFDALPVYFDHTAWRARFLANWPPGSPAHTSYFERIVCGPDFGVPDAVGPGITLIHG